MSEFTKGSWFSAQSEIKAGKHRRTKIYCVVSREDGTLKTIATLSGTTAEAKANARLIAAAPEMYEAITECANTLEAIRLRDDCNEAADLYEVEELIHSLWDLLASIDGEEAEA